MIPLILLLSSLPPVADGTPNRQPQLAAGNGIVALVYGSGRTILFAKSTNGGDAFTAPAAIAELPTLALGRHRGPRVAVIGKTILVSAINGNAAPGGDLLLWRSTDAGRTWLAPQTINDTPAAAREGLHAMAADGQGHAAAVWLDLRDKGTRLYGSFSNDAGATWSKNALVYESPDGTICQCCHPSLAALGNGEFAVMFRNAVGGSRDLYLGRIHDGRVIAAPAKLGNGTWTIAACPMDGGAIAVTPQRTLTAWRRGDEIFLAEPGMPETRLGAGKDVALAANATSTWATWSRAAALELFTNGTVTSLSPAGAYPSLVAVPQGGALAAWEQDGRIEIRRVR